MATAARVHLQEKNQCKGKTRLPSGVAAVNTLYGWSMRRKDIDMYNYSIYPCQFCHQWHIGSRNWRDEFEDIYEHPHEQLVLFRVARKTKRLVGYNEDGF